MPKTKTLITLSFVSSVDGKITLGNNSNVHNWSSKEDQLHFAKLIKSHPVIIISSKTYEVIKKDIKHSPNKLRIVMTKNPQKYQKESISGQLEFTSETPRKIIDKLTKKGIQKALLAAGSTLSTAFLKAKLVNSLILTIEPLLFGKGIPLIIPTKLNINLQLKSFKKLNSRGTILLTYDLKY